MAIDRLAKLAGRALRLCLDVLFGTAKYFLLAYFCLRAVRIRMHAVNVYGYLIHEFDPWFNYRATVYLQEHGWRQFFHWYDYMSWYPLGRPVGTTIYPGMQIMSVALYEVSQRVPKMKVPLLTHIPKEIIAWLPKGYKEYLPYKGKLVIGPMSLNDLCCLSPAWFGGVATFFVYLLTAEVSGSTSAGVVAAFVMAIIPAHLTRSGSGGYDNEAFAVSAFCAVFWLWCRAVRTPRSCLFGALAGVVYIYAASTWGGYIFVNNLIGLHAFVLVGLGKYNYGIYLAYTLFFAIGTAGATFVPVIGWTPLRSMEQIAPLLVFLGFQVMALCDIYRHRKPKGMTGPRFFLFRVVVFAAIAAVAAAIAYWLMKVGYFAPLSARIRALFIKHKKTGNPLVDSVAEHSATPAGAVDHYLSKAKYPALVGLLCCWHQRTPAKFFPVLYAVVAYHFSMKMSRLVVICGPIVSMLAGFPIGIVFDWCLDGVTSLICGYRPTNAEEPARHMRTGGMGSVFGALRPLAYPDEIKDLVSLHAQIRQRFHWLYKPLHAALGVAVLAATYKRYSAPLKEFIDFSDLLAEKMAHPTIVFKASTSDGREIIVDDYLVGYRWVKDNTPKDARVIAWWDYGYQITGIANRTSLADGNTWNHEHIATLGRTLTNPEQKAHNIMVHLADYALVWTGGKGDPFGGDIGKSTHLARIANSVFPDVCGSNDPLCSKFSFYDQDTPTPMMAESFLYKAVNHNKKKNVRLSKQLFQHVYTSQFDYLRVFKILNVSKESKKWVANWKNRICDAPGSWYCTGQYPPALKPLIDRRRNFAQLEDFNKKGGKKSAYTKLLEKQQQSAGGVSSDI